MSSEEKKDGPDHRPTAAIEKPPPWAISIMERMNVGFSSLERRLDLVEGNVDITGSTVRELSGRITRMEGRMDLVDDRLNSNSVRARQTSDVDLKQDSAIATIVEEVAAVKADVGNVRTGIVTLQAAVAENTVFTKQAIAGFFKTPLGMALLSLAMAAAGYATNWLTAHGGQ